jgi:hypothetical protein
MMNIFEVNTNDLSLLLTRYKDLCLKELTYYGTSDTDQMLILIRIGQEISRLENIIVEDHYNLYVRNVFNDKTNSNIYYLQKILFDSFDIVNRLVNLWMINKKNSEEFDFKSRYLVGWIENFVDKFLTPVNSLLDYIVLTNKFYKPFENIDNLKKFIILNKNKFSNKEKISKLDKFIKLLE